MKDEDIEDDINILEDMDDLDMDITQSEIRLKTILRLFPFLNDKSKANKLKIDDESLYFISLREHADNITKIIKSHLVNIGIDPSESTITDATAGVGGNTISFGMNFKKVYAIELDKIRADYLDNNIKVYCLNNVEVVNGDCTLILDKLDQTVVFIDPPWGGKSYKDYKLLKLQLSSASLEMVCNHLLDKDIMKVTPKLIVLKLPNNYDIKYLYKTIKCKNIYFYDMKKMFIMVIVNHEDDTIK